MPLEWRVDKGSRVLRLMGIVILGGISSELLYRLYRHIRIKLSDYLNTYRVDTQKIVTSEVIFFPDQLVACKKYFTESGGCNDKLCSFSHIENSLSKLYELLNNAVGSISVCVYVISCWELAELLIAASERGVNVRVITDDEQVKSAGSQVWNLRSKGVSLKTNSSSSYLMHHKFVVIDDELLITGSFNWTRQAIMGNQENLLIIQDSTLVNKFNCEFEKLWSQFDTSHLYESH